MHFSPASPSGLRLYLWTTSLRQEQTRGESVAGMSLSLGRPDIPTAPPDETTEEFVIAPNGTSPLRSNLYGLEPLGRPMPAENGCLPGRSLFERKSSPLLRSFAANERSLVHAHGRISQTGGWREARGSTRNGSSIISIS